MDTQSRPSLEIEAIASSPSYAAADAIDCSERFPTSKTGGRAITRWLLDAVLLAGAAAAALHCGVWRDPTDFPPE